MFKILLNFFKNLNLNNYYISLIPPHKRHLLILEVIHPNGLISFLLKFDSQLEWILLPTPFSRGSFYYKKIMKEISAIKNEKEDKIKLVTISAPFEKLDGLKDYEYLEYFIYLNQFDRRKLNKEIIGNRKESSTYKYDFAFSFAGEDRNIVRMIVDALNENKVNVFYDEYYEAEMLGKKLSKYFQNKFGSETKYVVVFISKYYPIKDWTNFEFSIARDEAKLRKEEYILPVKLDDTKILGIHDDIGYIDYRTKGLTGTIRLLLEKLKKANEPERRD